MNTSEMKVLMLGWELPPRLAGGLGTACAGLSAALRDAGVDVRFLHPSGRTEGPERRAHPSPYARREPAAGPYGGDLERAVRDYALLAQREVLSERYDLIHAHDWTSFPGALAAQRVSGLPLVCHVHSLESDRASAQPDAWIERLERQALRSADRVLAVSDYTAHSLRDQHALGPERLRVVHNGVEPPAARVEAPPSAPCVLFLGRLTSQKDPLNLLAAAEHVCARRADVEFIFAGEGELFPDLLERAATLGLAQRVRFVGFLEADERERAFARADLLVLPSRSEPFGLVALEAAVRGVPVVLTTNSGVREVLEHRVDVVPSDAHALTSAILRVLDDPALAAELARGGRADAARATWSRSAALALELYRELPA